MDEERLERTQFAPEWQWFGSTPGRYLRCRELEFLQGLEADLTGDSLLWVGLEALPVPDHFAVSGALLAAAGESNCAVSGQCYVDPGCLPVRDGEFDVVILQHGIDCAHDPYAALREAARAVRNGGWLLIYGLNPWSPLGAGRYWGTMPGLNSGANLISPLRMADWLAVLGFRPQHTQFLMYRPFQSRWWHHLKRWQGPIRPMLPLGTAYALATRRQSAGSTFISTPSRRPAPRGLPAAGIARTAPDGNWNKQVHSGGAEEQGRRP